LIDSSYFKKDQNERGEKGKTVKKGEKYFYFVLEII